MIVRARSSTPPNVKMVQSASPVMIPGKRERQEHEQERDSDSRPKNWKREIASEASVPSTSAIAVAASAACSESQSACRTPSVVPCDPRTSCA